MNDEPITYKQGIILIILSVLSSYLIFLPGLQAGKDVWAAYTIALICALPFLKIHDSYLTIYPGKDIFDILKSSFGGLIGGGISILYILFAFSLGALLLEDFAEVIITAGIPETPRLFVVLTLILLCILICKYGLNIMAKWSELAVIVMLTSVIVVVLLLSKDMKLNNLKPALQSDISEIFNGALSYLTFPIGDVFIFSMIFTSFNGKGKKRVYSEGVFIVFIFTIVTALTVILVGGPSVISTTYFPFFKVIQRMNIGNFIQRGEILILLAFIIGGVIEISLCLLAVSKGIGKFFNYKNYNFLVTPIGFMMLNTYMLNFKNAMEFVEWDINIGPYYFLFLQYIIPTFVFIGLLIKRKLLGKKV